ncbi:MAG: LPS export ABC transporter periplasmic protein LptC [Candidatus Margulisbacteria bacterium]|nr:LPS export ABC transporter periplasmic protein LptC [Candidatus Margulisiibacteriota bacterium]
MDENISWKIVYIACIFSLVILGLAYFLISPKESPYFTTEKMQKIAEFKNTRVSGRKEGKKVWELLADEGWTDKDRIATFLNRVKQGKIYRDEKLIVADLTAPRAKAFRHSEIVEAFGPGIKAYLELGRLSKNPDRPKSEWTRMTANYLKYIPKEKRSIMQGDIELHQKNQSIYAQDISIDYDRSVADISNNVKVVRLDGYLTANFLQYYSDEERFEADGHVYLNLTEVDIKTEIKSQHASLYTDIAKDINISGNVEAVQGKKYAVAQNGIYSQQKKELDLKGEVKTIFEKAKAILKEDTSKKLKSEEGRKILEEKTILTADELIFSTETGDAQARGSVEVTQKNREARADWAVYNEREESILLTGNVFMKKINATPEAEEEWVKAKQVAISVKDETFEASGSVDAVFKL